MGSRCSCVNVLVEPAESCSHFLLVHGLEEGCCRCFTPYHTVWPFYFGF